MESSFSKVSVFYATASNRSMCHETRPMQRERYPVVMTSCISCSPKYRYEHVRPPGERPAVRSHVRLGTNRFDTKIVPSAMRPIASEKPVGKYVY
jgi:hypothetical protein